MGLPKAKLAHLLDPANLKELDAVLEYHVVAGTAAFAQDLTDGEKIKTVEGDSVLIKLNDATGHATGAIMINDATAIITDIAASNGVIHIINKVLDPSTAGFNIVEVAAAQPELSTLVTALKAGKLVDYLSAKGPFTVFAPANGAFAELPKAKLAHLLDPADLKELDAVLEYHVVAGTAAFAQDLTDGEKIKTVEGDSVLIKLNDATGHATGAIMINDATAIITDIEASNGVIHIINKVLDPSTAGFNIVEVAAAQPELSTLVTALKAGKLVDALSAKGPFTVFAPANGAFAELPKAKLAHLLDPANVKELDAVLEYHVVAGTAAFVKDLT